jgi:Flp pilus assembly protein TadG
MKEKLRTQRGTAVVEFALILPLLVVIVFGIIEFSILFYDKAMVTNASREGARVGIVFNVDGNGDWVAVDDGTITTTVNNYLRDNILSRDYLINLGNPSATTASTTMTRAGGSPGGTLTVSVTYTYTFMVIPNFIASIVNPITLTAQTVMRFE